MNLFYTWGAILGPYAAGAIYERTHSYQISTAMTAKPWAKVGMKGP
jgi:hypothetical protein